VRSEHMARKLNQTAPAVRSNCPPTDERKREIVAACWSYLVEVYGEELAARLEWCRGVRQFLRDGEVEAVEEVWFDMPLQTPWRAAFLCWFGELPA
jgi:hypothetical protein